MLKEHMKAIQTAATPDALENAFQAALSDFRRRERGLELCAYSEDGTLVPRWESRRRLLHVAGKSYRVPLGGNSTGIRYAWHDAHEWARSVLREQNLCEEAIGTILDWWRDFPHRALRALPE